MVAAARRFLVVFSHNRLTGVTTFNVTLARWLAAQGHEVHAHVAFRESKLTVVEDAIAREFPLSVGDQLPRLDCEATFVSDAKTLRTCKGFSNNVIAFAHGLGPLAHEYEADDARRVRVIVAVSPFMTRHYAARFPGHRCIFLPNVIDLERFMPRTPLRERPRTALLADRRRAPEYVERIRPLFRDLGIELVPVAELAFGMPIWDMHAHYQHFDMVVGCGRSAYEAMASGRNVIVLGVNGGDGFVERAMFDAAFDRNCSGYGIRSLRWDDDELENRLRAEVAKYSVSAGAVARALATEQVDALRYLPRLLDAVGLER